MSLAVQISGFAVVGTIATGFQYGLMTVLIHVFKFDAVLASTLSYALSALLNYTLNRHYVFRSRVRHVESLLKFSAIVIVGLLLNSVMMHIAVHLFLFHWIVAQVLVTVLVMLSNFVLSKYWVFQTGRRLLEK